MKRKTYSASEWRQCLMWIYITSWCHILFSNHWISFKFHHNMFQTLIKKNSKNSLHWRCSHRRLFAIFWLEHRWTHHYMWSDTDMETFPLNDVSMKRFRQMYLVWLHLHGSYIVYNAEEHCSLLCSMFYIKQYQAKSKIHRNKKMKYTHRDQDIEWASWKCTEMESSEKKVHQKKKMEW